MHEFLFTLLNKQNFNKEDIQRLLQEKLEENEYLEYKVKLPDDSSHAKKEFAKDIAAFANSKGGILIFGIEQEKETARPKKIVPIEKESIDENRLRLESIIRSRLEPVPFVKIIPVEIEKGKYVLVLRIYKSELGPCWEKDDRRFYIRTQAGKSPIKYEELKELFLEKHKFEEKIKDFIHLRLAKIKIGDTIIPLFKKQVLATFFIPIKEFERNVFYDLLPYKEKFFPCFGSRPKEEYSFEGLYFLDTSLGRLKAYSLFHRKPAWEDVICSIFYEGSGENCPKKGVCVDIIQLFGYLCKIFFLRIKASKMLNLNPPFLISINLLNVKDVLLNLSFFEKKKFKTDDIMLPSLLISEEETEEFLKYLENKEKFVEAVTKKLRERILILLHSAGFEDEWFKSIANSEKKLISFIKDP